MDTIPTAKGPLDGIRIFDLTIAMVGPWSAMLLGSLGAEVFHVQAPDVDHSKGVPPSINGTSIGYLTWNMNKRGLILDLKQEVDQAFARRLIETCDVFMCNMRPGVPDRLGLSYEDLHAINPRLIYCTATGYGSFGPRSRDRGADPQIQALTGYWAAQGARGELGESYSHYTQIDAITGDTLAQAILMALYARKRTGEGQRIDITMLDASATLQLPRIAEYLAGADHVPRGSSAYSNAPDRAFLCEGGEWLGISVTTDAQWHDLCAAISHPELADDERFADNAKRLENIDALEAILVAIFETRPQLHWAGKLERARIPFGTPLRWDAMRYHRQLVDNDYLIEVETPAWGTVWTGGPPWQFSKTPARMQPPPVPGEATAELKDQFAEPQPVQA
jgi:crotonobetainyl-CoA:carnitine CoA-transferase CaiB-like acyl-CoA transferase